MDSYLTMLLKLVLSIILGALIGYDREYKNRPAGLRTNILVCLGATLVQIINIDIFNNYKGVSGIDPARFGAQVISGIGFLGAGTILREGASIKGLTTAASLWVVACIGLAIGNGSYIPAIATAILAFITLTLIKGVENRLSDRNPYFNIEVRIENRPGGIGYVGQTLGELGVNITNIEFIEQGAEIATVHISLKIPGKTKKQDIINKLRTGHGVISVDEIV